MKEHLQEFFRKVEELNRIMYWVGAMAVVLASLILTYQVIMRYFLKIPTIWEIEAAIYLGIFATFMGAAYGLKEKAHIEIDLVTRALPPRIQSGLYRVTSFASLLFCILLAWKGWEFWWEAFSKGWTSDSLWGPPLAIPYFFLPMGATLLSLQYLSEIFLKKPKGALATKEKDSSSRGE